MIDQVLVSQIWVKLRRMTDEDDKPVATQFSLNSKGDGALKARVRIVPRTMMRTTLTP